MDATSEPRRWPRLSPFCGDLRSKKFYFLDAPALTADDLVDASCRTWCVRTMQVLGPDGRRATPDRCRAGRACFRGARGPEA